MKRSFLLSLLFLLGTGLFAQREPAATANKTTPTVDPHLLQGPPQDIQPPTVVCLNGLNNNVSPTGSITFSASDFLQSVSDNETPADQIKIGIRPAGTGTGFPWEANGLPQTSVDFNCSQLGAQSIELWAIDLAGNEAYCEATVMISDDNGICNLTNLDTVVVCIHTGCDGAPMPGVPVFLDGTSNFVPPFTYFGLDSLTDANGCANIVIPENYIAMTIVLEKDDAPLNGLTTYDLLLMVKHILGIEPLDNPYKMIAADANKSGSITSFDIVEFRKLILGLYQELPNNTSWRFVDADFEFPNPMNPFSTAFPETISISGTQPLPDSIGFIAVKIGDLDCSAMLNGAPAPDYPDAFLAMPDTFLQAGMDYSIPLFMAENGTWQGYQFSLNFDPQKLDFQAISYHSLSGPSNWNVNVAPFGTLTTSWTQFDVPGGFGPGFPIATFHFHALENGLLKDIFKLNPKVRPEAYTGLGAEKRDLLLTFVPQFKPTPGITTAAKTDPTDPTQLVDSAPPSIVCLNGLIANILPNGTTLWATDFLSSVSDNVTPGNQIKLGIRRTGSSTGFPLNALGEPQPNISITCADADSIVSIELWAMDGFGNTAFCTSSITAKDLLGNCGGNNGINIYMCAKVMCSGEPMEEAIINLEGSSNFAPPFSYFDLSGPNGCMHILNSVPVASTFTITPEKDDNPLNGVDAQDIELISKHIDGTQPFTEPWQWIAADVNRDGLITMEDIDEIQKLVLGVYLDLPNNTSWRFVLEGYQFPTPNPLSQPFPESVSIANALADMDSSFLGIKIGDLNCSGSPTFSGHSTGARMGQFQAEKTAPTQDPGVLWDYGAPKLSCVNGVSVNILPTGMVNLWVPDFLLSVSDNATPANLIQLGVRKTGTGNGFPTDVQGNALINTLFTCNELGTQGIELWAKDLAGNTAHCETYVVVEDNFGKCSGQTPMNSLVKFCARTEQNDHLEEMTFSVAGQNPNGPFFVHDLSDQYNDGCVYFDVPLGSNIVAAPFKDDNPLNGVTTYDLVLISKHIRGIEPLNTPFKLIAADADRNGIIDSTDIVELWKLITGEYTKLPNNASWRFVDKSFTFPNQNNPFETVFPESLVVENIQGGAEADFVAIKVGDVNGTAIANNLQQAPEERNEDLGLSSANIGLPNPNPTAGSATIPVYLTKPETMRLEVSDLTGKVVWSNELSLESGSHLLEIPALAMPGAGVYVWQIQLGTACKAGKLIRL